MHPEIWETTGHVILITYSPAHLTVFNSTQRKVRFPSSQIISFGGAWDWVVLFCCFGFFSNGRMKQVEPEAQRHKFLGPTSLSL